MAKNIIKNLVKGVVETGTSLIIGHLTKCVSNGLIPKKNGFAGLCQDACVGAARFAITYRATESMGEYIEKKYDKTAAACKDIVNALNEIGNKEETENGEKDADEARSTIEHTEACGD